MCVVVLKMGHSGDGCFSSSILLKDECGWEICVLSWARVRQIDLGSVLLE